MQTMNEVMPKRYQVVAANGVTVTESNDLGTLVGYTKRPSEFKIYDSRTGQTVVNAQQSEKPSEG
jgi:hypothetical protein